MPWEPKTAFTALAEYYGALEHRPEIEPPFTAQSANLGSWTAASSGIASDELHNLAARVVSDFFPWPVLALIRWSPYAGVMSH
jgi:hypothetical protein